MQPWKRRVYKIRFYSNKNHVSLEKKGLQTRIVFQIRMLYHYMIEGGLQSMALKRPNSKRSRLKQQPAFSPELCVSQPPKIGRENSHSFKHRGQSGKTAIHSNIQDSQGKKPFIQTQRIVMETAIHSNIQDSVEAPYCVPD